MNRLFLAIGIAVLALLVACLSPAIAQPANCAPRPMVDARLFEVYGETARFYGIDTDGQTLTVFYASGEGGSWTVVIVQPNGIACLVASGGSWSGPLPEVVPDLTPEVDL